MNRSSWLNVTAVLILVLDSFSVSLALASSSADSKIDHHQDPALIPLSPDRYTSHLRAKIAHSVAKGERRASEREVQLRLVCQNCSRPETLCVCNVLPSHKLSTKKNTQILILQHPNERRKKNLSTVPLLRLVLENVQVVVGYTFEDLEALPGVKEQLDQGRKPLLLYPKEDALSLDNPDDLALLLQNKIAERGKSTYSQKGSDNLHLLILVDGTWTEAKRMVRDSPTLVEHCQSIQFTSDTQSIYDALRREPEEHCLSTLEACTQALIFLEEDTSEIQETLQRVLQAHVDAHLANSRIMAPRSVGAAAESLHAKNKRRQEIEISMFRSDTGGLPTTAGQDQEEAITIDNTSTGNEDMSKTSNLHGFVWQRLPDGAVIRSLQPSDAPLVDSWWEYRSSKSLPLIVRRIQLDEGGCCLGVADVHGNLVASIMRYEGGAVGMLYVLESARRKGYGTALLQQVTRVLESRGEERVAFIVDGNHASQNLFQAAGWEPADATRKRQTGKRRAKRKWVHYS